MRPCAAIKHVIELQIKLNICILFLRELIRVIKRKLSLIVMMTHSNNRKQQKNCV